MNEISVSARPSGRSSYQVVPDPDDPVILQLDGQLTRVLEVSASGFTSPANVVKSGRRYMYSLDLPTATMSIKGYVDVLPERADEELSCVFVDLSADELDMLHHYVLLRQKEAIRAIRSGQLNHPR